MMILPINNFYFLIKCTDMLAMLTGKTVLLNSVQEFIEIEAWLLFDRSVPINSIVTYLRVQVFEKHDSSNKTEMSNSK